MRKRLEKKNEGDQKERSCSSNPLGKKKKHGTEKKGEEVNEGTLLSGALDWGLSQGKR